MSQEWSGEKYLPFLFCPFDSAAGAYATTSLVIGRASLMVLVCILDCSRFSTSLELELELGLGLGARGVRVRSGGLKL